MYYVRSNELMHYGVMGMHWGERRYQNEDGSYKPGAEGRYAPKGVNGGIRSRGRGGGIYGVNERYYSNRANTIRYGIILRRINIGIIRFLYNCEITSFIVPCC